MKEEIEKAREVLNDLYQQEEELHDKIYIAEINLTRLERLADGK